MSQDTSSSASHHHGPPPPPEPQSPMWLPALGATLFLLAGIWWIVTPPFGPVAPDPSAEPAPGGAQAGVHVDAGVAFEAKPEAKQRFPQGH